jgi:hypothetical protein
MGKEAAILIHQAIPCIMHLENRCGEKLLNILLAQAAAKYQQGRVGLSLEGFVMPVQQIIQQQILGTQRRPKQWRVPLSMDKKEIAKVGMSNKNTRKMIDGFDLLIQYIYYEENDNEMYTLWMELIAFYRAAIRILRKRSDYTDEDIEDF